VNTLFGLVIKRKSQASGKFWLFS